MSAEVRIVGGRPITGVVGLDPTGHRLLRTGCTNLRWSGANSRVYVIAGKPNRSPFGYFLGRISFMKSASISGTNIRESICAFTAPLVSTINRRSLAISSGKISATPDRETPAVTRRSGGNSPTRWARARSRSGRCNSSRATRVRLEQRRSAISESLRPLTAGSLTATCLQGSSTGSSSGDGSSSGPGAGSRDVRSIASEPLRASSSTDGGTVTRPRSEKA
jgi:hypothetical protein